MPWSSGAEPVTNVVCAGYVIVGFTPITFGTYIDFCIISCRKGAGWLALVRMSFRKPSIVMSITLCLAEEQRQSIVSIDKEKILSIS